MEIIPAIDLRNQQSVRLYQGDFEQTTLIAQDPLQQAKQIETAGLKRLHLVDLDGAKSGRPVNRELIKRICAETDLKVEVGGGIRTLAQINGYLTSGVSRVILGSAALTDPQLVQEAVNQFGNDQVVVGIDGKDGKVAISGWLEESDVSMSTLMTSMVAVGVVNFVVTDITKDGTLSGPNVNLLGKLQQEFPTTRLIASGGVTTVADLQSLADAGIKSAIVGRAMATGDLPLKTLAEVSSHAS
ncbi:1-(5-phosphoribosyl)-5-[(5-phosphoribosylamino)methylideneamino]imidazole-4-carboxamide isomerase [Lactobacillus sp. LC28-10]|uniref:1-(5-phosphoribosyl)-5-[(5-phosphoribosylamino)methylideneamino] imidazole-4-carboxamide isomerase n=1 Tax=Secundilactobacillus angelensis TaxID=2722706 RepID=A0ABX1KVT8_9LACO|nr:1-(5-phosphoribosyl)-5-[(5-phosphoribosylamino)methylideneamino]imidazole-4-carboxamide isomerase [Secundilactobacillus angelensis]MCH5462477.1 1-(5-phosphoribosyl)-5-[(5-phosphoribosylamino)methylideneamino]imidazole-4-carboxamide isomerase [Secundilactobacillus angelensis]NLR18041.1 1-(5-phosphoribosyl)-5-[(5-phosphoribosylamino)methylideneamino]imidazole-4-carboxamide isomerase [Secundilactobacillus angelensis]